MLERDKRTPSPQAPSQTSTEREASSVANPLKEAVGPSLRAIGFSLAAMMGTAALSAALPAQKDTTTAKSPEFAPEPQIGGSPLGLSKPKTLTERIDPSLSKTEADQIRAKIEKLAGEPFESKGEGYSIRYPALGRYGQFSNQEGVSLGSFDAISQERLDSLKTELKRLSGYSGEILLRAPNHVRGPTYSGPKQEYQHIVILGKDQQEIGVLKFTNPVEVRFIPQIKTQQRVFLEEPNLGEPLVPARNNQITSPEVDAALSAIAKIASTPIPAKYGEDKIEFPALGKKVAVEEGVAHYSFKALAPEYVNALKRQIQTASGIEGKISLKVPDQGDREEYEHLLIVDPESRREIGVVKFTEPAEVKVTSQLSRD